MELIFVSFAFLYEIRKKKLNGKIDAISGNRKIKKKFVKLFALANDWVFIFN